MLENKLIKYDKDLVKHVNRAIGITNKLLKDTPILKADTHIEQQEENNKLKAMLLIKKQVIQARQWQIHQLHSHFNFIGENNKNIVILSEVDDSTTSFLFKIIKACKLELEDVVIINIERKEVELTKIISSFLPKIILLFGVPNTDLTPILNSSINQIYFFEDCKILSTYDVLNLMEDNSKKRELWFILKSLFNL